jgi:hypothetical protein
MNARHLLIMSHRPRFRPFSRCRSFHPRATELESYNRRRSQVADLGRSRPVSIISRTAAVGAGAANSGVVKIQVLHFVQILSLLSIPMIS